MKLIYLKSALKYDSFDVAVDIKIQFFRVLVTIEPGRSLLQFVTTNCLKDIRNLQISLRSELLFSHVFITYMRGFTPSSVPRSLH